MNWESASIYVGPKKQQVGDFAIKLTAFIEAGNRTGYIVTVKRAIDLTDCGQIQVGITMTF